MQPVVLLYKSNPEYFVYEKIEPAISAKKKELLHKAFPHITDSNPFNSFTKESFNEIISNLLTYQYPVLSASYEMYLMKTTKLTDVTIKIFHETFDKISKMNFNWKEDQIIFNLKRETESCLMTRSLLEI